MNGARPGYEPDHTNLTADERVLILETQLRLLRDAIDRINALADVVVKVQCYTNDCAVRSARIMEYLDRLEKRASTSEAAVLVNTTRIGFLEKSAYAITGFLATLFSGAGVYFLL